MPTCQACKCTNTTGKTTKRKSFFKIPEPRNATQRKWAQQWLHNMSIGQDIKTFKFSRNSVLCENHFHKDCRKIVELVEGVVPTIFAHQIFDPVNMDGTKVLLTGHVSDNKRKGDAEKDHQQVSFVSQ